MVDPDTFKAGAEATKAVTDLVHGAGSYVGNIIEQPIKDLVGYLGGDAIRHKRMRNYVRLQEETMKLLESRGVKPPFEEVSPSIEIPLISAAVDTGHDELRAIFAKLLAAAMDPDKTKMVRASFVETVSKMDPIDALVFTSWNPPDSSAAPIAYAEEIARSHALDPDEARASMRRLEDLGVARGDNPLQSSNYLTPYGRLLRKALS